MWKKEEGPEPVTYMPPQAPPRPEPLAPPPATPTPAPSRATTMGERATIGRSITVRGDVMGDEDLLIQGRIEGSVNLKQNAITVGREGEVKADLSARLITVEGRVQGNITAEEQVILRSTAVLQGNITAPRVVLEDGARFRGGVDTGETPEPASATTVRGANAKAAQPSKPVTAPEPASAGEPAAASNVAATTSPEKAASTASGDGSGRKRTEVTA